MSRGARLFAAALAIVAAGCGGGTAAEPTEGAGRFIQRIDGYLSMGRYEDAWAELHPDQQRFVPRQLFVACYRRSGVRIRPQAIQVLRVRPGRTDIPGAAKGVEAKEVTVRFIVAGVNPFVHVQHAVLVDGSWRWLLASDSRDTFVRRSCPALARRRAGA